MILNHAKFSLLIRLTAVFISYCAMDAEGPSVPALFELYLRLRTFFSHGVLIAFIMDDDKSSKHLRNFGQFLRECTA